MGLGLDTFSVYDLTLRYTGVGHNDHPQQLWSFKAPTGRFGLVQSSYEFGHMGTNYDPDQKKCLKISIVFELQELWRNDQK